MTEQTRTNRIAESRAREVRPITKWAPAELLPEVDEEPGYAFRWIRTSMMGQADAKNVSSKFREGWEPVKASDHPEAQLFAEPNSRFKDAIEVGGLILCKTPVEFVGQRNQHFQGITDSQIDSVDNTYMKDNDPRMSKFSEKSTKVTFGSGS
jgi:hypothetical protein